MPLPLPKLDSRTWAELTTEGRALIPRAAPDWTDHNVHDPGITLMELYAWLAEMLLFRLDRVTPALMRAFLRLLGVTPRAAAVAETVLALRLDKGAGALILPNGIQVSDRTTGVVFEAPHGLTVSPAWIELEPAAADPRCLVQSQVGGTTIDQTAANATPGRGYWAFGTAPRIGDALCLGFDRIPAQSGVPLTLHVWTMTWTTDGVARHRIATEWEAAQRDCAPSPRSWASRKSCEQVDANRLPTSQEPLPWWHHYWARTIWEYLSASGAWLPLEVVDKTRGLTLSGPVEVTGPPNQPAGAVWSPSGGRWWLRSRLAAGNYECPSRIAAIAVNSLPVRHAATQRQPEWLGRSQGQAHQLYQLSRAPVIAGSTQLRLTDGGQIDDSWQEVGEWDASGPADRHYLLSPETGTVSFGDGRTGMVPQAGASIEVLAYRVGGGSTGNLPAGRLTTVVPNLPTPITIEQPFRSIGGTPAESVDQAHGRALEAQSTVTRSVTLGDLEALAIKTPGVPVARAKALPSRHPRYPCFEAAGVVGLVVLPACGSPPAPSPAFLAEVQAYMERRRPLTTEVRVVGPQYVPVTVTATIHAASGASAVSLRQQAQKALDAFFDPLRGGPHSSGWPFGRDVLASEVLAVLSELPQVNYVDALGLAGADGQALCVNLPLCSTELVHSQPHLITVVEASRNE